MTKEELKEKAISEKMVISKIYVGKGNHIRYIWDEKIENILAVKKTQYDKYLYFLHAKGDDSQGYRITKKLALELKNQLEYEEPSEKTESNG